MVSRFRRTIVFDLDDTLYDESEYVQSGKRAVAQLLAKLFGVDISEMLMEAQHDFIATACRRFGLEDATKESLLWAYRLHQPTITPRSGVVDLWQSLRNHQIPICILTDGRAITQRLKVDALGLRPDGFYISESIGAEKPSLCGYQLIERDYPSDEYVYVADNPKKDFIAPHQLGWQTFGIRPKSTSIHVKSVAMAHGLVQPQVWVSDFSELSTCLLI